MEKRRVVITGLGVITPIGIGKDAFWSALIRGCSGIKEIQTFDASVYSSKLGGEMLEFHPEEFIDKEKINCLDRVCQLGLSAAKLAIVDSLLDLEKEVKQKIGVIMGTTTSTFNSFAKYHKTWLSKGISEVDLQDVKNYRSETIPNSISYEFGLEGVSVLIATACAAGTYAVGEGFDLIRYADADIMLVGGAEAISELAHCGFNSVRSLAKIQCRPFDRRRDGLIVSEGSAVLVLEALEHALKRKANIYAEIVGYGLSCDANHMTAPDVSGDSAALSIQMALADAEIYSNEVDYINAHGTGTPLNEKMETNGIKKVFGSYAYKIPVSSIKSMIGHTFGASGAIEAVTCSLVLVNDIIPPTINYEEPDPECDLDYVPNVARKKEVNIVLSNSFAFGGNNATLIFRKYKQF
jgi:3-oxoacyl-[acyl-carrier-protein] synthase II